VESTRTSPNRARRSAVAPRWRGCFIIVVQVF
jgi:hypothetical protein